VIEINGLPIAILGGNKNFAVYVNGKKVYIRQNLGLFRTSLIIYTIEINLSEKNYATAYFVISSIWIVFFSFVFAVTFLFPVLLFMLDKLEFKLFILVDFYILFIFLFTLFIFKRESKKISSFVESITS